MAVLLDDSTLSGHHEGAPKELVSKGFLVHDLNLASITSRRFRLVPLVYVSVQNLALGVLGEENLHSFAPWDQYM